MTPTILALAMAAQPEARVSTRQLERLAAAIWDVAHRQRVPPLVLGAIVLAESGGRSVISRGVGRGRRGCDVGIAQVHLPGCPEADARALLEVKANLRRAALVMTWSERKCTPPTAGAPCHGWTWGRYNPGSSSWSVRVQRILARMRRFCRGQQRKSA